MLRIIIIIAAGILFGNMLHAQSLERQVIASTGSSVQNAGLQLDYTVGEVVVTTLTNTDLQLTQGFHQGQLMTTGLDGLPTRIDYRIYPNPVTATLWVSMEGPEFDYIITLYSTGGQEVPGARKKVEASGFWKESFDLSRQAAGSYQLVISDRKGNWLASHQIIKMPGN
ncbi:MAG: T9SS type A sorting domain-containing protein [Saprospiraceae bacterium]|nr:T9SS type A sorting domain-containing protein [Lewinella sp.]